MKQPESFRHSPARTDFQKKVRQKSINLTRKVNFTPQQYYFPNQIYSDSHSACDSSCESITFWRLWVPPLRLYVKICEWLAEIWSSMKRYFFKIVKEIVFIILYTKFKQIFAFFGNVRNVFFNLSKNLAVKERHCRLIMNIDYMVKTRHFLTCTLCPKNQ